MQDVSVEWVAVYASLFVQRWDQYAVQQRDGSYWRVTEPLSLPHLSAHLAGRWTVGTYLLDASSHCSFAVFDADEVDGLECLAGLAEELLRERVPTLLEASRRGGHLWVHLVEPTPAQVVRAWLLPYAVDIGVELYPKQDWLAPGGSGSLIRLPLGVHQQSRGWYPFVRRSAWGELVPVGQTVLECCAWACQHLHRVAVPASVEVACSESVPMQSELRMRMGLECGRTVQTVSHWEYGSIRQWCRSQDIEAVIGRYVALDRRGVGSCPFKEHHYRGDVRPSFQVFGGSDPHWYCYTWRRAGDLFDFLCLYDHLTPHEVWQRVQQGGLW
jgi:CHC2 zinc finger